MNDHERPDEQIPDGEIDCGKPVAELAALRGTPGSDFQERVIRGIGRRRLAAEMTQVSVQIPLLWLMEILNLMFHFFTGKISEKGGPDSG